MKSWAYRTSQNGLLGVFCRSLFPMPVVLLVAMRPISESILKMHVSPSLSRVLTRFFLTAVVAHVSILRIIVNSFVLLTTTNPHQATVTCQPLSFWGIILPLSQFLEGKRFTTMDTVFWLRFRIFLAMFALAVFTWSSRATLLEDFAVRQ